MFCVITGASSGIGRAAAISLSSRGARLLLCGRSEERLRETLTKCAGAEIFVGDVTDSKVVTSLFARASALSEGDDLAAVFAAGVAHFGDSLSLPENAWHESVSANLTSLFLGCREAMGGMVSRGGGHIVNVLSIAAKHPFPQAATYGST